MEIRIPCELIIKVPDSTTSQRTIRLETMGEAVFDDFEKSLSPEQRVVVGEVCNRHARCIAKYGELLEGG